ncbi:MAG: exosortase family protein XrtF [Flammeovirgaceae bacterium]|nr:MAG: exosortase family protein XrtF [Flammeovirgaceae bacterium]
MHRIKEMVNEFKPAILFLAKFVGIYLLGNLLYGWYITSWYPAPDPVTSWVTHQSADILKLFGWDTSTYNHIVKPTTYIVYDQKSIIAVYEGCNGLNVVIIFLAFLIAFGPISKKLIWFVPLGIFIIHISNLARIILLFLVSLKLPDFLYFTHKYLFTAFIFLFVFLLWLWWIFKLSKSREQV